MCRKEYKSFTRIAHLLRQDKARAFFFQNLTLGYMTNTLNQILFFLHQNENIFFSNIGNQNIFLEKKNNNTVLKHRQTARKTTF
jgi:hypothetical protein